ncbi:transcriptional regulator CynR [Burkholderia sp. AU42008]|uniref:transcriptional regulator CynR n=1 Tax=unclassified Burkholderia TaxID=2613784 RepID=UPI000B7AAD87|nr:MULTISPECIES: transcriptional regulator CynR [unclassified Burkholderia]RQU14916.1 transcriptional regulator CynR [Burkholderia cenocepacia]MBR8235231.1 transcriptional regulator CynR [Burkholderia sp. AU32357]MBY4873869.1 transcriptional regulator CynR [Burkholderia sp. AU42008]OXI39890.1 transcriptional regulator CynR [Burkholderia sp. AU17457]OXI66401.1 transcriptional regulator CynR [Burkholderia sp. AU28863]
MLLRHIHYFLAVAEHRSFTRAAAALHVSQPALSQQIRQLEDTLGAQLFDRTARVTRLTDAGDVYFRYARQALHDLAEGRRAIHDVQDLSRGSLRVAVTPTFTSYLVGPLVEAFHGRYPDVSLSMREMSQERIEALLGDGELDVGIAFDEVQAADVDAQTLLVETLALVVNRGHALAGKRKASLHALHDAPLVLLTAEFATRTQIDRYFRAHDVQPRVLMEANSLGAVIEIVRRTNLATLLPVTIAIEHDDLVAVTLDPAGLRRTAVLLQRKGAYRSAAARAFVELALAQGAEKSKGEGGARATRKKAAG